MNFFRYVLLLCLLVFSFSCQKDAEHATIPTVTVDIYVDVTSTIYMQLGMVGGYEYIVGGYKGIVVYRLSEDEFVAFDRACSYDPTNSCRLQMNSTGIELEDSCCTSKFEIIDGSVMKGPATVSLKQYHTSFDGANLHIFN